MANNRNPLREALKVNRKTFFNPAGWFDYENFVAFNRTIIDTIRGAFSLPKPDPEVKEETFEEAKKRQRLTEADLAEAKKSYKTFAYLFAGLAIIDLIYTFYLLFFHFSILGFLLGIATTALFLGQAFRFDFWAYQIEKRQLGVTIAQWRDHIMGKKGRS